MKMVLLYLIIMGLVCSLHQSQGCRPLHHKVDTEVMIQRRLDVYLNTRDTLLYSFNRKLTLLVSLRTPGIPRTDFIGNFLTIMTMVRRLAEEWTRLQAISGYLFGSEILNLKYTRMPNETHVEAAAMGVRKVQWTYDMDVGALASGEVPHITPTINVTAADCYHVSISYLSYLFPKEALAWLQYGLEKKKSGDSSIDTVPLLFQMAVAYCMQGNARRSHEIQRELLKIKGEVPNIPYYVYLHFAKDDCNLNIEDEMLPAYKEARRIMEATRRLCQVKGKLGKQDSRLRCRYVHHRQPHLRFQPFKLEELQLEPLLFRFYNVVTDNEVEQIQRSAMEKDQLFKAKTIYRTAKTALLPQNDSEALERLTRRMSDISQLNVDTAERSKISLYPVTGEFIRHLDSSDAEELNDVKEGGQTIFFWWNISVHPIKNSAILWFNFHPDGSFEDTSTHGGCPVVQGTKWILTKWFKNEGHEFTKHCGLNKNDSYRKYYM